MELFKSVLRWLFYAAVFLVTAGYGHGAISVDIIVLKDATEDASIQPPYYGLATSVILFCHARGAAEPISYQWSSTTLSFFAYNSTSVFNRKAVLTSGDGGVHMCSVTDANGDMGQATMEMKFNGATIYVARSFNFSGGVPANNSFIVHYPSSCSGCQIDFSCYSDSTSSGVGEVVFPDGNAYSSASSLDGGYTVERLQYSTLHVQMRNLSPSLGVFTCKLPDLNGNTIHTSIGVYASSTDPLKVDASLSGYTDLTRDSSTTAMAVIECYTTGSPPTNVVWQRNGETLDVDGENYETMQIVIDRRNSHYRNTIIISDTFGVIGNLTYTCEISNFAGAATHSINISLSVNLKMEITAQPHSDREGQTLTLSCKGAVDPKKFTPQLAHQSHMHVEWVGPNDDILRELDSIEIGVQGYSSDGGVRTLTINETSYKHAGLYKCQVSLSLSDAATHNSTAEYHLVLRKNITMSLSEESLTADQIRDLMCKWSGGQIPRMEWLFLGGNVIIPLEHTDHTWDKAVLLCTVVGSSGRLQHFERFTVQAILTNNVTIESSSDLPTAGENFTLTCSVSSDRPTVIRWMGPGGEEVHKTPTLSMQRDDASLSITFQPLYTSQGGIYTCISSIGITPSAQDAQQLHSVRVQIPAPTLTIVTEPENHIAVYSNTRFTVVCIVNLASEVDTPVRKRTQWNAPSLLFGNRRITVTEQESAHAAFRSIVSFTPVVLSDSGLYTCIANVAPEGSYSSTISGSPLTTQELTVSVLLNVSIQVTYNPPSDFTLPSPPYYRPASTVTLTCVAGNGVLPIRYAWSSTCTNCFASSSSSSSISTNILKSTDAGEHTCTVTDADGNTGYAATEMKLIGAGIYVETSQYISNTPVANNTAINLKLACRSCQLTFYCYSNSTVTHSSAVIRLASGSDTSSYSSYRSDISVQRVVPSGISLWYRYSRYYSTRATSGIYTCKIPDSNGFVIDVSIGLYFSQTGLPPSVHGSSYTDLTDDSTTDALAKLECRTRNSIATNVTWLRDGTKLDIDGDQYQTVQFVDGRYSGRTNSYFRNILLVRDLFGALGSMDYTCLVNNQLGNDSQDILLRKKVSAISSPSESLYGDMISLTCQTIEIPLRSTTVISIDWSEANGAPIDNGNDAVIDPQENIEHILEI